MTKKLFLMVFVLIFSLSISVFLYAQTNEGINYPEEIIFIEDLFENEIFMQSLHNLLVDELGLEYMQNLERSRSIADSIEALFPTSRMTGEPIYPDYVGGLYFDDNGNLVLQIVDQPLSVSRSSVSDSIDSIFRNLPANTADDIIIRSVEFSHNELDNIMNIIGEFMRANRNDEVERNIVSAYHDTINNRVGVELSNFNEREIARFREVVVDSPAIIFMESQGVFVRDIRTQASEDVSEHENTIFSHVEEGISMSDNLHTLRPGGPISNFSVGYRVTDRWGFSHGFITVAHAFPHAGFVVSGYGIVEQYSVDFDAAFVRTQAHITLLNEMAITGQPLRTTVTTSFRVGERVTKIGSQTGLTTGTILHTNRIVDRTFGLVETNYNSDGGDSGGIVFLTPMGPIGPGDTGGIHVGARNGSRFFTRASSVQSIFGLSRY